MSFFDSLGNFFKKIGKGIASVFTHLDADKIESVAKRGFQLAKWAIPAAQLVASYTPTKVDDALVKAGINLELSIEDIFTSSIDIVRDGGRQRLAAEALKNNLIAAIERGVEIKFGDTVLKTVADVLQLDRAVLLSAAQDGYDLIKYASK